MWRGKEVKVKRQIDIEKIATKEVTAEKEADPEEKVIAEKVMVTNTAEREKGMEAEEGVKAGATKVTRKAAAKTKTNLKKVLTCRGSTGGRDSWSRAGLYWHAPAGVVRGRDFIYVRNDGSSNLVAQETMCLFLQFYSVRHE